MSNDIAIDSDDSEKEVMNVHFRAGGSCVVFARLVVVTMTRCWRTRKREEKANQSLTIRDATLIYSKILSTNHDYSYSLSSCL
jgi:hypothetical protein